MYLDLQNVEVLPSVTDEEAPEFILKTIKERLGVPEIVNWLGPRTLPRFGLRSIW